MALALLIETATPFCSIAVAEDGQVLEVLTANKEQSHNTLAANFAKQLLDKYSKSTSLAFVAVSIGPGSYTGLRIGLSLAKGICFAKNIPLITVSTLQSIAFGMKNSLESSNDKPLPGNSTLISLIDARRMEAYVGFFNADAQPIEKASAKILDDAFLQSLEGKGSVFIGGNCTEKAKTVIAAPNIKFVNHTCMSAEHLVKIAYTKFKQKVFADLAYTVPEYIKQFKAGQPKKLL